MKLLIGFAIVLPLMAQDAPPPAAPAPAPAPVEATAAATPAAAPAAEAAAPSPVPSAETWFSGTFDVGERWLSGVGGSLDTYRSVVNLGSGPKLIGADFTILDLKKRFFDRIRVRAYNWGDDPFETLNLLAEKQGLYEFHGDFRRVSYFNNLPSFADPLLSRGITLDEQSVDTRRTLGSFSLALLPTKMISPYVMYDNDSSKGSGVSVFETSADEFAVPDTTTDATSLYRGGIHITGRRFHVTLEEGGSTFRSSQNTYTTSSPANPGNNITPVIGETLGLTGLVQAYGVRGTGTFSKAILTVTPFSWLDIYGHFLYSEPKTNVNYQQFDTGNLVLLSQLLFYTGEQNVVTAAAALPHTSGDLGWEIRPLKRVRILQSWNTDRLHNAASAAQMDNLLSIGSSTLIGTDIAQSLATNYSQAETNIIVDAAKNLTVRGGYRYVWGNALDAELPDPGLPAITAEKIKRQIGLGAANWRVNSKLSLTAEFEIGSSGGEYFRTSLYDYRKARMMGRYQLLSTLNLSGDYTILSNRNPTLDASYKFLTHQESVSVTWNPAHKKIDFQGTYEHCGYHSEISYLTPALLSSAESVYNENCHDISALARTTYRKFEVSAGGAVALTSGSMPTRYFQPVAKVSLQVTKSTHLFAEWRYYGLGEVFYMYDSFRAQLFTTGLRYTR